MSTFRKFKLPQLLRKGSGGNVIDGSIARFNCNDLPVKERIEQGTFGDVYTVEHKGSGDATRETVVIKKCCKSLTKKRRNFSIKKLNFFTAYSMSTLCD